MKDRKEIMNKIISLLKVLPEAQTQYVKPYIDVGEIKLALEVLVENLYESEIPISVETYNLIQSITKELGLNCKTVVLLAEQIIT